MAECGLDKQTEEKRTVLHEAYTRMRNVYGVVWEQLEKEYTREYGERAESTMQLAYFLESSYPKFRGILKGCVNTVLEERHMDKDTVATDSSQFHISTLDEADSVVEKIAAVKGVRVRYMQAKFQEILQSDTSIHYKRVAQSYREKYRLSAQQTLDPIKVVASTDKSRKKAIILFNQFVDEQIG